MSAGDLIGQSARHADGHYTSFGDFESQGFWFKFRDAGTQPAGFFEWELEGDPNG